MSPPHRTIARLGLAVAGLWAFAPDVAQASPWTLPQGKGVLFTGFGYQVATQEYLDTPNAQVFPLDGRYDAASLTLGARLGLTDEFEIELSVPLTVVSYQSDPVILLDQPDLDGFQENVINLSRTRAGVSDVRVFGRYRLLSRPLVLTIEGGIKIPTGYDGPAGTFGERPETQEEFVNRIEQFVDPDNVQDDVTLGDGQIDLQASLLVGYALRFGLFFRLSAGYRLRLGGAGDQVIGLVRVGQAIGRTFLVYVGAEGALSIQDGRVIGISVAAEDPTLPAEDYGGLTNLRLRELQLFQDFIRVGGGTIIRLTKKLEFNLGYEYTLWGRNTAAVHSGSVSLALKVDFF